MNADADRATLPAELTSFVGRRTEIAAARTLLRTCRLVTLNGIGGVGKTRLALRCAQSEASRFVDGVTLVELAPIRQPDFVATAVAAALGLTDSSTRSRIDVLVSYLRNKNALLVIDNCEHVLGATADLIECVLRAAPDVSVLATSRQRLGVSGEVVLAVDPLPLPAADAVITAESVEAHPALDLLVRRAAASVPGFSLDSMDIEGLLGICHQLEGIPLALELAAVRLKVLSARQLRDRLDQRLAVLTHGLTTSPPRQHTLRAAIDWSYDLCDAAEQSLWRTASVFPGGFTLDSIQDVIGQDEGADESDLLEALTGLVDRSVLLRSDEAGGVRFRMLETLREYGLERLKEGGEYDSACQRFLEWCLALVRDFSDNWFSVDEQHWFTVLQHEHTNVRAALESWLGRDDQVAVAQQVAADLWPYWIALALPEGRSWLSRAVDRQRQEAQWRRAMLAFGFVAVIQGEQREGAALLRESLTAAVAAGDRATEASATHLLGVSAFFEGHRDRGRQLLWRAGELYGHGPVHSGWIVSLCVHKGLLLLFDAEVDHAAVEFHRALDLCERAGDSWLRGYALIGLAFTAFEREELDDALTLLDHCLQGRDQGDVLSWALALDLLAWVLAADGQVERAATVLGAATWLWKTFGQELYGSASWIGRRQQSEEAARRGMGNRRFDAAYANGHRLGRSGRIATFLTGTEHGTCDTVAGRRAIATALTPREDEVARLVAAGLSNRAIAARLTLSTRTVEGHVQQVLVKLAFTSRTQIAAWLARPEAVTTEGSPKAL